jgi:hypothetical protein
MVLPPQTSTLWTNASPGISVITRFGSQLLHGVYATFSPTFHMPHVRSCRQVSLLVGYSRSVAHCEAPSAGAIKTTESPMSFISPITFSHCITVCPPRTNSISLCFLTVLTRGSWSSSSSSATNIVSSTSPSTRLQCES